MDLDRFIEELQALQPKYGTREVLIRTGHRYTNSDKPARPRLDGYGRVVITEERR